MYGYSERESEDFVNHIYNEEPSRTYIRRVYERIVRENNVLVKMISVRLVIVLCTIHIDISDDRFYCIRIKIKSNRSVRCFFFFFRKISAGNFIFNFQQ